MDNRPAFFNAKKWILIVACSIYIILMILYAALAGKMVDNAMIDGNIKPSDWDAVRKAAIIIIIVSSVIAIIFQLFGLIGAWREHFCLSVTYTVLIIIGFIFNLVRAFGDSFYWVSTVISLLLCIVAVLFVRDLHIIRRSGQTNNYPNF